MTLVDPSGGVGYLYGAKLPSAHMTTLATQQVRALDAVNGGTYTCSGALSMTLNAGGTIAATTLAIDLTPTGVTEALYLRVLNANQVIVEGSGPNDILFSSCQVQADRFRVGSVGHQSLTVDNNYTITGSLVKSTFVPTVDRTLTLSDTKEGRVILMRVANTSVSKNILIRDFNNVLLATLGAGAGTQNWIQIATDASGNGYSLAWDNGGGWTIAV